jgi:GTP-binding protein YchF
MLRAGLIGLPSSGKTTLFELLTSARDADRHHGKSEAHVGVSRVPDDRLDQLTALFEPRRKTPAAIEFADMAAGRTDTRALLDVVAYRTADALLHVVRAFENDAVPHPQTSIDPARDVRQMEDELILADLGLVERRLERVSQDLAKKASPGLGAERVVLERCRAALEAGEPLRAIELGDDDARRLRGFQLLSAKPLLLVINLDEADAATTGHVERVPGIDDLTTAHEAAVGVCAQIELEIADLEPADARAFMDDLGLEQSGLDRIIQAAYGLLGYISFFTVGEKECRAWSIPRGTTALDAAGAVHTDIQRGFIRAEVVPWDVLVRRRTLAACREHGELRLEGKEYEVADGDVITIRHAT